MRSSSQSFSRRRVAAELIAAPDFPVIMATGFSGEPRMPTFPMDEFKGEISHSSKHPGCHGKPEWSGKKAIVVGCCNSGLVFQSFASARDFAY